MTTETTISLARFSEELLAVLAEAFENSEKCIFLDEQNSLRETLATVTAEQASRPVSATCASIAAQVNHVIFYLDIALKILRNQPVGPVDWQSSWQVTSVTDAEWAASRARLQSAYEEVRDAIRATTAWDPPGFITGVIGLVAHSAYHLGEIRQALCTVR